MQRDLPSWDPAPILRYAERNGGLGVAAQLISRALPSVVPAWEPASIYRHVLRRNVVARESARHVSRAATWVVQIFDARPLSDAFGDTERPDHLFRAVPLDWGFNLTEPQITYGLVHFLNACDVSTRRRAFLAAIGAIPMPSGEPSGATDDDLHAVKVEAERERMDIFASWQEREKSCVAVVEAKVGAQISKGQLPKYHGVRLVREADYARLVVVAPSRSKGIERILRAPANERWQFLRWYDVLRRFEQGLARLDAKPDPEFARFRRMVWQTAA